MIERVLRQNLKGPGTFQIEVVGESFYEQNIRSILDRQLPQKIGLTVEFGGTDVRSFMATLRSEPSNDYDPNAIQVLIEDKVVGYLDRETAKKINGQLKKLGYDFIEAACKAIVVYRFVPSIGREAFASS